MWGQPRALEGEGLGRWALGGNKIRFSDHKMNYRCEVLENRNMLAFHFQQQRSSVVLLSHSFSRLNVGIIDVNALY